jgi:hypothetical protein
VFSDEPEEDWMERKQQQTGASEQLHAIGPSVAVASIVDSIKNVAVASAQSL